MLTSDQVTAIAPDAASLKAGRDLSTRRKWQSAGQDTEVLWGLAMGSGQNPYQTRVALSDLSSKCSCPSRKFPCKHAIGLMLMAAGDPVSLSESSRPPWVVEWMESRQSREQKAAEKAVNSEKRGPVDEKAAEKRKAQRQERIRDGMDLLRQSLLDFTREGHGSSPVRSVQTWENLAKRLIDSQAPGMAREVRAISERVLHDPDVERILPLELGRLYLLVKAFERRDELDEASRAELLSLVGDRNSLGEMLPEDRVSDDWFVAGRELTESDGLVTSASWLIGRSSGRWARVLKFAPVSQPLVEPLRFGTTAEAQLVFQPGLHPLRATVQEPVVIKPSPLPDSRESGLADLLQRQAEVLSINPFLRSLPFLIELRPSADGRALVDRERSSLPWCASADLAMRVDAICSGNLRPACGEWDGRQLRLLAIADGPHWFSLVPLQR